MKRERIDKLIVDRGLASSRTKAQALVMAGVVLVDGGTASPGERWSWAETESRLTPPDIDGLLWSELHERMARNNGAYVDPRVEAVGRAVCEAGGGGECPISNLP